MKLPLPVRLALEIERWLRAVDRVESVVREEIFLAWICRQDRFTVNLGIYSRNTSYLPGGRLYEMGLFDWEARALATSPFPSEGRILLTAAGGGRELAALDKMGYEVVAFEPSDVLAHSCEVFIQNHPRHRFVRASYEDLIQAANCGDGPLASLLRGVEFDGVILGWGSFSHVLDASERTSILRSTRQIAPNAPLLMSFYERSGEAHGGRLKRLRLMLRTLFARMGAPTRPEDGDGFVSELGFIHALDPDEMESMLAAAGYEVRRANRVPYPHVILVPRKIDARDYSRHSGDTRNVSGEYTARQWHSELS